MPRFPLHGTHLARVARPTRSVPAIGAALIRASAIPILAGPILAGSILAGPILAGLALPGVALGSEVPRIAVVGIHEASLDEPQQLTAVEQLVAAIEADGAFDGMGIDEVATALGDRSDLILEEGLLSDARVALQNGKNAYNQASPDDAIVMLESAITSFRDVFPGAFVVEDMWETWVYLGTSHLQRDPPDEAAAEEAFAGAIALLPKRPLNPAMYPPHVIERFEGVRTALTAQRVTLEITTTAPSPVSVWVDGVQRGATPLSVPDILPGEHFLVGRGPRSEAALPLRITPPAPDDPDTRAVLPVALDPIPPTLGEPAGSPLGRANQTAALYGALGRRSEGIDYVLVAGMVDGSLSLQLLRVATGTFSNPVELPLSGEVLAGALQAMPLLLDSIAADGSFVATAPAPAPLDIGDNRLLALLLDNHIEPVGPDAPPPPPPKRLKAGVVLGVIGGVLAAGAASTGGYLLLRPDPAPGTPQGTVVVRF